MSYRAGSRRGRGSWPAGWAARRRRSPARPAAHGIGTSIGTDAGQPGLLPEPARQPERERTHEDAQVAGQGAPVQVLEIELELAGHDRAGVGRLPSSRRQQMFLVAERERGRAGDARPHAEHSTLRGRVQAHEVGMPRPWPDKAHFAPDHVPQLGCLVELGASQEASDPGHPWISGRGDRGTGAVRRHRAQLEDLELDAIAADTRSAVEDRSAALNFDRNRSRGDQGRDDDQGRHCDQDIEGPLHYLGKFWRLRFLILTQYFPPEVGAPQVRLLAMGKELKSQGHDVRVVTAMPSYPRGRVFAGYRGRWRLSEEIEGLPVTRTWIHTATGSGFGRLAGYLSFALTSVLACLRCARPRDPFVGLPAP